jgi:hypothetical protein
MMFKRFQKIQTVTPTYSAIASNQPSTISSAPKPHHLDPSTVVSAADGFLGEEAKQILLWKLSAMLAKKW